MSGHSSSEMDIEAAIAKAADCMGFSPLKDKQLEAIFSFMSGRDTFVCLPTGYGKSVIYAVLRRLIFFWV